MAQIGTVDYDQRSGVMFVIELVNIRGGSKVLWNLGWRRTEQAAVIAPEFSVPGWCGQ